MTRMMVPMQGKYAACSQSLLLLAHTLLAWLPEGAEALPDTQSSALVPKYSQPCR